MNKLLTVALFSIFFPHDHFKPIGSIERFDKAMDAIISTNASVEIIAEGFKWSEGPVWLEKQQTLLFSDIPSNSIYKWTEAKGKELYLQPSGYTGVTARGGEMGSNGLLLNSKGQLVMCQHGNRQMALMNAPIDNPQPVFTTLAGTYQSKKFNSPNDAVYRSNGDLFFTDPPYGLEKNMQDSLKELSYQGVYKVNPSGVVKLLTDTLTRPNGIAFMSGEKTLLIANSDGFKPFIYAYDLAANDSLMNPRIFCNGGDLPVPEKGGFDGIKVDRQGNVFASGPGGICLFNKDGKMIGRIKIPGRTSNCAFADDEKTLFITADMNVLRLKMR
jgi:gluconolactonase